MFLSPLLTKLIIKQFKKAWEISKSSYMSKIVFLILTPKPKINNIDCMLAKEYQRFTTIQLSLKGFRVKICCKGTQDQRNIRWWMTSREEEN